MAYIHTKTIVEHIEILKVIPNYIRSFDILRRHRPDISMCELCEKDFTNTEPVGLAFTKIDPSERFKTPRTRQNRYSLKRPANIFVCQECAQKAVNGGAIDATF